MDFRLSPTDRAALGLSALSAALAVLAYPNFNLHPFALVFAIPWLWALDGARPALGYLSGVVFGTLALWGGFYWLGNWAEMVLKWQFPLNHLFGFGYALVCGQCFGLIGWLYTKFQRPLSRFQPFSFALVWLLVFSLFPWLFPFKLADSQTRNLTLIQPIEFFGAWGLDFLLLTVNGTLFWALRRAGSRRQLPGMIAATVTALAWVGYGAWVSVEWDRRLINLPTKSLGIVQTNRPASIERIPHEPGHSPTYPLEFELSQSLVDQGAEVLLWPEGFFYGYAYWVDVKQAFEAQVKQWGVPLLFLDSGWDQGPEGRRQYNTTFFIDAQGQFGGAYHKRHLVPFGETTPLVNNWPWLKSLLGKFLASLSAGTEDAAFEAAGLRWVPKICYEALYPDEVAQAIGPDARAKVILVQSQDGWYGQSNQPQQHLAASVLRAVENRVPMVHVINNGPSAVALPNGKLSFKAPAFEGGAWIAPLPYGPELGGSFYSRHPGWFLKVIQVLGGLVLVYSVWFERRRP